MPKYQRTALITGGTSGVGHVFATRLAKRRPDWLVVIASRNDNGSANKINTKLGQANVKFMSLDLSSLDNVRSFAKSWASENHPPIQVFGHNSILQSMGKLEYSADGYERTFAISHMGHALLLALISPYLDAKARIVITGSGTHDPLQKSGMPPAEYKSAEKLAHPPESTKKESDGPPGFKQYASVKLANVLWMYALERRIRQQGLSWTVLQCDPGFMPGTSLARHAGRIGQAIFNHIIGNMIVIAILRIVYMPNVHTPDESGTALSKLALDDGFGVGGATYLEGIRKIDPSMDSKDEKKQEDLWRWTVDTLAKDEKERKLFECDLA